MVTKITFVRIDRETNSYTEGTAYFIDSDSAVKAICAWNTDKRWSYALTNLEQITHLDGSYRLVARGQLLQLEG